MITALVVGAGKWAHECWAPLLLDCPDRYEVHAVVDPDLEHAESLAADLGLPSGRAYRDIAAAISDHPQVRVAMVLSSPEQHADCIVAAAAAGLDVLTEKPLVTTPDDAARVTAAAHTFGTKLAVVQNYRYQSSIQRARALLREGGLGDLRYLTARFAADYRDPESWDVGDAHTMDHPLLLEASIHHLDMIRYLTGRNIATVTAATGNPPGSSFAGDCVGGLLLQLTGGGMFALYEANLQEAGAENRWRNEYYRAELARGSVTCDGQRVTVIRDGVPEPCGTYEQDMFAGHRALVRTFADWVDGGPAPDNALEDNLHSLAAVFAALESAVSGTTVQVRTLG